MHRHLPVSIRGYSGKVSLSTATAGADPRSRALPTSVRTRWPVQLGLQPRCELRVVPRVGPRAVIHCLRRAASVCIVPSSPRRDMGLSGGSASVLIRRVLRAESCGGLLRIRPGSDQGS